MFQAFRTKIGLFKPRLDNRMFKTPDDKDIHGVGYNENDFTQTVINKQKWVWGQVHKIVLCGISRSTVFPPPPSFTS